MKIIRFTKTERLLHWSFAVPVILLVVTGVAMIAVSAFGLSPAVNKEAVVSIHVALGFVLIIMPALVFLAGDRNRVMENLKDIMSVNAPDRMWLKAAFLKLFKKKTYLPDCGKFNAGQKLNTLLTMTLIVLLAATGFSMLIMKGALISNIVHASLSLIFLCSFTGHLYLAFIHPPTRHALRAITSGRINAAWLREHHGRMYRGMDTYIYGDILFEEVADRDDLKTIYNKYYSGRLAFREFKRLAGSSELLFAAKKQDRPVACCRIVGDGMSKGYVADYFVDDAFDSPDLFKKMMNAAAAAAGHKIYFIPQVDRDAFMYGGPKKGAAACEVYSISGASIAGYENIMTAKKGNA